MKSLGILIDKPGHSQKFRCLTEQLNKLDSSFNVVVFYTEPGIIPIQTKFSLMHVIHSLNFEGIMISTDLYTTQIMLNALRPTKRFFYVWDLEYMYDGLSFAELQTLYNNDKVELISRNEYRDNIMQRTWKKSYTTMEDFNYERLQQLF